MFINIHNQIPDTVLFLLRSPVYADNHCVIALVGLQSELLKKRQKSVRVSVFMLWR
jgi:hypothetical protein